MTFSHDAEARLFTAEVEGHHATLSYTPLDERTVDYQSTYVPHGLRNRHVGTALVKHALDHARATGWRVIPSCWFVKVVVEQNPEYREVLAG